MTAASQEANPKTSDKARNMLRALSGVFSKFEVFRMKFRAICENHLYSKAYSKGKRAVTSALAVYVLPDYAASRLAKAHPLKTRVNRIGLTVSTKLGGAVVRSRVRRILRAGLTALEREKPLKTGFLIVIAARGAAVSKKSNEIEAELGIAFTKLGMFKEP